MIVAIYEGDKEAQTEGCGCCSRHLSFDEDRDEIIGELKENIKIVKEACEILDIDFERFIEEVIEEIE